MYQVFFFFNQFTGNIHKLISFIMSEVLRLHVESLHSHVSRAASQCQQALCDYEVERIFHSPPVCRKWDSLVVWIQTQALWNSFVVVVVVVGFSSFEWEWFILGINCMILYSTWNTEQFIRAAGGGDARLVSDFLMHSLVIGNLHIYMQISVYGDYYDLLLLL